MSISQSRCFQLFIAFFSISAVALGGGLTMLPMISREFVEKRKWMTDDDMIDTVAIMQSLPGIISVNMSVLVGYRIAGLPGAISATLGVIVPPFSVILLVATCLSRLDSGNTMNNMFLGIRAAVTALILVSVIRLCTKSIKNWMTAAIAIAGFILMQFFKVNIILLIAASALAGFAIEYIPWLRRFGKAESKEDKK